LLLAEVVVVVSVEVEVEVELSIYQNIQLHPGDLLH
jgi:hypothetical protein